MNSLEILFAQVGHRRLMPKKNEFLYDLFYVVTPITPNQVKVPYFLSFDRFNVTSLFTKDHGAHDGSSWREWIVAQCANRNISLAADDEVFLISHPRLLGYVFNPISFWLVFEKNIFLKAVLCEVRNTFGDNHNYLLAHEDGRVILPKDTFTATKGLYVSPFNNMDKGWYRFSFEVTKTSFRTSIDYFEAGSHILEVFMKGTRAPLTTRRLVGAVFMYPLMTLRILYRIHKQAVRLYFKGVKNTLGKRPASTSGETTYGNEG
jgi:DUF1365 family protein